jgi:hypothetical protein
MKKISKYIKELYKLQLSIRFYILKIFDEFFISQGSFKKFNNIIKRF